MKNHSMPDEPIVGFLVNGISLPLDAEENEACSVVASELKRAGISPARLHFQIYKKSVDARKRDRIRLVYSVAVLPKEGQEPVLPNRKLRYSVSPLRSNKLELQRGETRMSLPPLVVGMGPAGLFCALLLAEEGYAPILIDRGESVSDRLAAYHRFVENGVLDTESNIQFGAGGAGTFSDGKLMTRINDPRTAYVLERFCEFGAPREILLSAKPHIGTDLLLGIVDRMLKHIESLGGRVLYRCCLDGIRERSEEILAVTNRGEIRCSALILAPGNSARDTFAMLMEQGYLIEPKPISVGVRIEHLQERIDTALYGAFAGHPRLGRGEYHLSDTTSGRGVYTFCMCPGGQVVAAASEEEGVVVNGMSRYARDGKNANSAVCVSVFPQDYGGTPAGAIAFQRQLERAAYVEGGRDYFAPIQTVGDFLEEKTGTEPSTVQPSYRDGRVRCGSMDRILPEFVCRELRQGLRSFEGKLPGFSDPDAVLTGVETRTSAPIRILRGDTCHAVGHHRIYPCGEGAGYAGGITSAAVDGIRVAQQIIKEFAPPTAGQK